MTEPAQKPASGELFIPWVGPRRPSQRAHDAPISPVGRFSGLKCPGWVIYGNGLQIAKYKGPTGTQMHNYHTTNRFVGYDLE